MRLHEIPTPALIIDKKIVMQNLQKMQEYAEKHKVNLRPHTKTHKMQYFAKLQEKFGAKGITVAKVGEAEVMARNGLKDIFIANEIAGDEKFERIIKLTKDGINLSFGIDSIEQSNLVQTTFEKFSAKANVLIEIEVGENRSGVIEKEDFAALINHLKICKNINFKGIFSHDGHSYKATNKKECEQIHLKSQKRTLEFASIASELNLPAEIVSIGSTPSLINDFEILKGITEIRPGTYIFMDASQAMAYGDFSMNAATVLTTIISKPTDKRVITDVGAKGLTQQRRTVGFVATPGLGKIKGTDVWIDSVYDEHAIIYDKNLRDSLNIGDKIEIYPNHICPVVNLYEFAYLIEDGQVVDKIKVSCRGKIY
ncbi:alanine racemase [Campylobacter sp. MOP7]|uniref:alanine racemase n=1 Tax=Campylobacter canis TaxID=3378588 RepID=UPI00387EE7C2